MRLNFIWLLLVALVAGEGMIAAARAQPAKVESLPADAATGLDLILNCRFLPRDFHQSTFDELWRDWPEPLRTRAERATPEGRRKLAFERFGFTSRTDEPAKPLQYVVDNDGWWAMNCFACHGGKVAGQPIAGAPNSLVALETLYEDLRRTKKRMGKPLSNMDVGSMVVPMGTTIGCSNAVVFGIALMAYRDKNLDVQPIRLPPQVTHHDMDAPAWWNVRRRSRLYIDGFVEKNHRALVPFVMDQRNSGERLRSWEDEFEKVYSYIHTLNAPKYPFEIDRALARQGEQVFQDHCRRCHGDYGDDPRYPNKIVDIDEIGTDPVRLRALTPEHRQNYHESWYAHYGADATVIDPAGYQAPPLNGIWASAPYFHNGSVPTLWHVLNSNDRPSIWRRTNIDGYDRQRVGVVFERVAELPANLRPDQRRQYFDTSVPGKSAAGHSYPDVLSETQKRALLEFLKTL